MVGIRPLNKKGLRRFFLSGLAINQVGIRPLNKKGLRHFFNAHNFGVGEVGIRPLNKKGLRLRREKLKKLNANGRNKTS